MSRSHVDLCKAEHLIRPMAPLGQTQPLEPTVVQQMSREYVANTSLFERSLMKYFSENPHQVVANAWHQCSNLIAFTSCQCSKKLFVIVCRFAYPNPAISQPSGQVFVQAPWPIAQGVKIWQALANKPLSHSKLSRQSKKDLSVASRLCEEKPWIYTLLTRKDFIDVFTLQSCWFYLILKVVLTSEGLILTQFSNDTDLHIPSSPCLARAMPFRISDTSCIANVSATSCYVVAMKSDEPVYSLQLSAISSWLLSICGMLEILFNPLFPLYYTCNHLVSKTRSDFWAALHIFPNIDVLCLVVFL